MIVSLKRAGKGVAQSSLPHYVAHSKINYAKEHLEKGTPRPLFSLINDSLSYRKASRWLAGGKGQAANHELIHLVVAPEQSQFQRLGTTIAERKQRFRDAVRQGMRTMAKSLGLKQLLWVAGIHLNTNHAHAHVAIQRMAVRADGTLTTIKHIPKHVLPRREHENSPGTLTQIFTTELAKAAITPQREQHSQVLAAAFLAKARYRAALNQLRAAKETGATWRFPLLDQDRHRIRRLSQFDLEQRSQIRPRSDVNDANAWFQPTRAQKLALKEVAFTRDFRNQQAAVAQHRLQLNDRIAKAEKRLAAARKQLRSLSTTKRDLQREYAQAGEKLPAPALTHETLDALQEHAFQQRQGRRFSALETLRSSLKMPRNADAAGRLTAQSVVARAEAAGAEKRLEDFRRTSHLNRHNKERYSLADIDRELSRLAQPQQRLRLLVLGKTARHQAEQHITYVQSLRPGLRENLATEEAKLAAAAKRTRAFAETVNAIYGDEQKRQPDITKISPRLQPHELRRLEDEAFKLGDSPAGARLLNQLLPSPSEDTALSTASRALARKVVAHLALREAHDNLANFVKYAPYLPVQLSTGQTARLADYQMRDPGAQLLRQLIEPAAAARQRQEIVAHLQSEHQRLKEAVGNRSRWLQTAEKAALEGKGIEPEFTPAELVWMERYGERRARQPELSNPVFQTIAAAEQGGPIALENIGREHPRPPIAVPQPRKEERTHA